MRLETGVNATMNRLRRQFIPQLDFHLCFLLHNDNKPRRQALLRSFPRCDASCRVGGLIINKEIQKPPVHRQSTFAYSQQQTFNHLNAVRSNKRYRGAFARGRECSGKREWMERRTDSGLRRRLPDSPSRLSPPSCLCRPAITGA